VIQLPGILRSHARSIADSFIYVYLLLI